MLGLRVRVTVRVRVEVRVKVRVKVPDAGRFRLRPVTITGALKRAIKRGRTGLLVPPLTVSAACLFA